MFHIFMNSFSTWNSTLNEMLLTSFLRRHSCRFCLHSPIKISFQKMKISFKSHVKCGTIMNRIQEIHNNLDDLGSFAFSFFFHRISGDSPLLNTEIFAQSVTYTDTWFSLGVLMNAPLNWLNSWLFSSRRSVLKEWGALVKRFESGQEPEGLWQRLNDTIEICIKYTWNGFHCLLIASMETKSHGTRKKTKTVPRKELTTFIVVFFWWLFCYTTSVNLSILHMSVQHVGCQFS